LSKRSPARRVTIADIAARAGVSKSTVSHTLSGKRPISPATQRRVRAVIEEVGYRPNAVAQRLAGGDRTHTIGLVFPLSSNIGGTETEFIVNVANAASAADMTFLLLTHLEGTTLHFERMVASGLVDGCILMHVQMADRRVDLLRREQIPFVLVGRCADNTGLAFVDVDIEAGIAAVLAQLAQQGRRTVAYLPLLGEGDFGFAVRALHSFQHHCQLHQLTGVVQAAPPTLEGAEAVAGELLQAQPDLSAILVRSKIMAEGVGRAVLAGGRQLPTQVVVIGMGSADNQLVFPQLGSPQLGSPQGALALPWIDIRPETLAVTATQFLLAQLTGAVPELQQRLVLPQFLPGSLAIPTTDKTYAALAG